MAISFIPEIWAAVALDTLKKSLVYAQDGVVNRDYEGEISAVGDTVRVRTWGDPTVAAYTKNGTVTYQTLTDAQRALVIDQAYSFSFKVDDIDRAQARGELAQPLQQAAYKMRDTADQLIAGLYTDADSANQLGTVAVTTGDLAYNTLVDLAVLLDVANVPTEGRWVVVPPWYHGLLRKNTNFINAEKSADGGAALRNAVIGEAAGFTVFKSNNAVLVTGDDYAVMAGHPSAISYAEQINSVETMRLQTTFGDGVRGLHLYGAKVMRPSAIATVVASKT